MRIAVGCAQMAVGGQVANPAHGRRFAAFISYSHADAVYAGKLQSRLERYRLPKHIAAAHAEGQAALGQIFRDREDLAAAPSLSDAIRAAIAEAEALIVICSPDAQSSHWVGEEIALFRSLHPDRPILAALIRGEPEQSFPAALTKDGNEPLAADLRKEADGQTLGFLKIVAGIAGVPLDALVQRDAQRRVRRVMWITGAALAAMLVMGVMTTLAIQARNEAARQRAEAEGLVEYMLTDLREKLKGVNRPEVMIPVNERAMEHYRRQGDLNTLPAESLERRARILHLMGEDDDRSGDLNAAQHKFAEAHRTTAALLSSQPDNADRIFAHAQSEYWVGYAAWRQNHTVIARKHWHEYLKQAKQLHQVEPETVRSLMELGYAHGNLCDLLMKQGVSASRGKHDCQAAIDYQRRALRLKPRDKKISTDLSNRLGAMADTMVAAGEFEQAIANRTEEKTIVEALLVNDPKNFELQHRQQWAVIGLGWAEYQRKNYRSAEKHLNIAVERLNYLSEEFPQDTLVKISQVRALIMLAMTCKDSANINCNIYYDLANEITKKLKRTGKTQASIRATEIVGKYDSRYLNRRMK